MFTYDGQCVLFGHARSRYFHFTDPRSIPCDWTMEELLTFLE